MPPRWSAGARRQAWGYAFLLPALVLLAVFKVAPMLERSG